MTTHARLYGTFATVLVPALLAGALAPAAALAKGVTAGTLIRNTATANFDEAGVQRSVNSNTVTLRVDELLDVTLTSLDPGPLPVSNGESVLTFELTNQGNGPEAFRLTADTAVAGNGFDTTLRAIAIDRNGNGTYEEGIDEILAGPQTTPVLAASERVTLFVIVTMPSTAADGETSNVALAAAAVTGIGAAGTVYDAAGADGGDAIVGSTGAAATARGAMSRSAASVALVKSVTLRDPFGGTSAVPGAIATFAIAARVSGSGSIANLVVSDIIPEGTTYVPGTLALDTAALTDAADTDAGSASGAAGIAVSLGDVPAGTTRTVTFDVTINN